MPADGRPGEFELIARLFAPLARAAPGAFGLTDDVAVIAPKPGHEIVVKTDAIVESVDFFRDDPPGAIARKALRVNLSDLAAKGAAPTGYLLTLLLPDWPDMAWLEAFAAGLAEDQAEFALALMGGDMSATPGPLAVSVTAFGEVPQGTLIRRSGARPGDLVFVSGSVGDSGGGLAMLSADATPRAQGELVDRYHLPRPRLALGQALRGLASAALDVSDGLLADLGHLATASGVHVDIDADKVPLSPALVALWGAGTQTVIRAATAGDDYEIAFTAPSSARETVKAAAAKAGVAVAEIGRTGPGRGVSLRDAQGAAIEVRKAGYTHF